MAIQCNSDLTALFVFEFLTVQLNRKSMSKNEIMGNTETEFVSRRNNRNASKVWARAYIQGSVSLLCPGAKIP